MTTDGLHALVDHGNNPRHRGGPVGVAVNVFDRDFTAEAPNPIRVTDIPCIRTCEDWPFLR